MFYLYGSINGLCNGPLRYNNAHSHIGTSTLEHLAVIMLKDTVGNAGYQNNINLLEGMSLIYLINLSFF